MANDLKMEVILQAIDRATRPIRAITQGSVGLGRALKDSRDQLKTLQEQQRDVSSWRTLRAASEQTETALQAARDRVKALGKDLAAAGVPTRQMTRDLKGAIREATALKKQHQEQQVQLQGLRNKLGAAGISTRNLSQHERDLRQRIEQTNKTITEQGRRMQRLTAQTKQLAMARAQYDKTQQLAGSMAGVGAGSAAAGAAMGMPVLSTVQSYMSFEDAMAGVAKQVEGARDDNGQLTSTYFEMADAIKAMAQRIPMATTEIAALVEGAARMGVTGKDNLLAFAEVAANAATAFELPADQIGENLARIADLYKIPIQNVSQLGDAINYLDDNAKSKGADIIEVLQRTAGVTASVGMSYKDAAALGSTFLTLGATAEVAGTATNAMIRELAIATQQPARFQSGLKALGLEAKALQNGMAENATGTLQQVLDAINKLPKAEQLGVTTQLFGKEFGDDAAKLAQNIGEYRRQLELANSVAGAGSMQREADIRAELMSARLEMAKNRAFNLSATLGETLRPTLVELFESFNSVVSRVNDWVKANPKLAGQILKTVAGVAALAAGFGAVTLGMASFLGPFAMARYALTLFGIKGAGLGSVLFNLGKVALPIVGKAILFIGRALMMNPIGLAVTAIAGAAYLIYKNWEPIKAFFLGLWAEIKQGFAGGLTGIATLILNFSPLGLFYRAFAAMMNYFGVDMPAKFSDFGGMLLDGLVNGIKNKLGAVKDAISSVGDSTVGWFKEKLGIHSPSRVFAELGGFTMQGLEQGLVGGQAGPLGAVTAMAKQLAAAGAVTFGLSGPAIAMDNRPPLSPVPAASARAAAAPLPPVTVNVYPSAGMNEQQLAQLVGQKVAEAMRANQIRNRSSLSDQE
ncbi:phage tail tape measure protein [Pseudomonas qingdaonensis]|uniref:phage tail tape measure protein n=1 Tax=Pseudomonas qingdaonensis TaxID=2056231 RepID=UPI00265F4EBF|nr:phage tail tape measure protein [Pseudomonas qingdaonensis]WKL67821.1 phage tail tape measure protein [Pseudomonas qingdaonensis]